MKIRVGARICSSVEEMWATLSNPNDTAWFLRSNRKIKWFNKKKIPQDFIDLMNGKKIKAMVFMKDWRIFSGKMT